ncbi:hypothetical protein MBLNU459_g2461t1 [Dothideomycetes sp. NU459]
MSVATAVPVPAPAPAPVVSAAAPALHESHTAEEGTLPDNYFVGTKPHSNTSAEDDGERSKKRRITRACDLCNKRRVKCDGQQPCSRCAGQDVCKYARAVYKRGKPSRSALLERQNGTAKTEDNNNEVSPPAGSVQSHNSGSLPLFSDHLQRSQNGAQHPFGGAEQAQHRQMTSSIPRPGMDRSATYSSATMTLDGHAWDNALSMGRQQSLNPDDHMGSSRYAMDMHVSGNGAGMSQKLGPLPSSRGYAQPVQTSAMGQNEQAQRMSGFYNNDEAIETNSDTHSGGHQYSKTLKYPVLKPLLPYVASFLSEAHASSLLELYFSSPFNTYMHPIPRHVHAFVFRKISVLSKENPRMCSPALLASMLWAAAETGGPDTLAWSHSKRINICRRLRIATIQLLRPLVHVDLGCTPPGGESSEAFFSHRKFSESQLEQFSTGSSLNSGTLDDVITYIHIAAITSASEEKAMSMRWWHAAFALARELRLNREPLSKRTNSTIPGVSPTANNQSMIEFESDPWFGLNSFNFDNGLAQFMEPGLDAPDGPRPGEQSRPEYDQETLEERRRTWWILYIQDRHLALCYNRQNALLDAECEDLLLPLDESSWQSGTFLYDPAILRQRPSFPSFECTGHNIYGWFLPLMTIVGTILDYNHVKNHHTLGKLYAETQQTQMIEAQILTHLDIYSQSLVQFEQVYTPSNSSIDYQADHDAHHTKTVVAYARHVIEVSRVLLAGKWDPVSLFDDRDLFMATPSFTTTIANAISGADHVSRILDVDPDLSFVPYFLGIQLLQGSLPLLLIVDRLQTETDPKIINACEVIIRATEACVSTLDTEYQRNYRQILRSAVSQARGRYVPKKETQYRRHTVLALYRWTKNGTGLAL